MTLKLHTIKPAKGSRKKKKRVGRGDASGHGTYSTRGMKGQRSRSGGKGGLKIKGMKRMLINLPKYKGFKSIRHKPSVVNIKDLEEKFKEGDQVNPKSLYKNKLIDTLKVGVKILGDGKLTKKLVVSDCDLSAKAKEEVEKAGGSVEAKKQKTKKPKLNAKSKK